MQNKIQFENLPQAERNILTQLYGSQTGYVTRKISYVAELSNDEKYFFDKDSFISPNFFVQRLYKVAGNILPLKFNLAVNKLIEQNEVLRTNFCAFDDRTVKVIFAAKNEMPEIVYRNLENVPDIDSALKNNLEADMRRTFDLRYDSLIRFSVFHTGAEEYAILITMPKILEESFEVKNLFRSVLGMELLPQEKKFSLPLRETPAPIKKYWENILQDLPQMPQLPFAKLSKAAYKQSAYRITIPPSIMSDLREKSKSNRMMLMTIFQTAWALLLQSANQSTDTTFSTLIPDKTSDEINSIPVRVKVDEEETLQNLINRQFKQLLISQPYACKNFSAIHDIIKLQNKSFDHFLSFGDFMKDEQLFSKVTATADGAFVLQNSWNAQNTKLGIYFNYKDDTVSISILYDENKFANNFGEIISRRLYLILQQMVLNWNLQYKVFMERLEERFKVDSEETPTDESYILHFLSQLKILQGEVSGTFQRLINIAKFATYFEGDRVTIYDMDQNFIFVSEGKLVRSLNTGDGWYNTLDIVKENRWLNENVLLENRKTKMAAEVLTEKAVLMFIPMDRMRDFLQDFPSVRYKILQHILGEMEKYQRLWIQA